jgi:hypothetical protein
VASAGDSFACVLPFTPPFALEVRRLLPDTTSVWHRSLWAAGLMALPAALALLVFALERAASAARGVGAVPRARRWWRRRSPASRCCGCCSRTAST